MTRPKTFLVATTHPDWSEINRYLEYTGQTEFMADVLAAGDEMPSVMKMASLFAKLCYKSLVAGKNANVARTRTIADNIKSVVDSGHGSVLEHVNFSFITTGCSRVFTHELVRHRVGSAYSQTSGRYCAIDEGSEIVLDDPMLEPVREQMEEIFELLKRELCELRDELVEDDMPFATKKKLTSALRRLAPSGLANEIAWTMNLRALRHVIELRTSPHAEWEIREVFMEVAEMLDPIYLYGGTRHPDGSWTGLRV